jgi:hypothetical protein
MTTRNATIDYLKLTLAVLVLALHSRIFAESSAVLSHVIVNGLTRIAVPAFFIINGYYFGQTVRNAAALKTWVKRIAVLYAVWMMLYLPFYLIDTTPTPREVAVFFKTLITGYFHLWYLMGTLGACVMLYFLRHRSRTTLLSLALGLYLIGLAAQFAARYAHLSPLMETVFGFNWIYRNFLFFSFPMCAVGYVLARWKMETFFSLRTLQWASATGLVLLLIESALHEHYQLRAGGFDMLLSLILVCPALFALSLNVFTPAHTKWVSNFSVALFLVHPVFVFTLMTQAGMPYGTPLFLSVLVLSCLAAALILVVNKKVRYLL